MGVASFVSSVLVSVLSAFLAFSSAAEHFIIASLDHVGLAPHTTIYEAPSSASVTALPSPSASSEEESLELSVLPSSFEQQEYGGPIPKILLEHSGAQQAAVVLAPTPQSTSTAESATEQIAPSAVSLEESLVNIFCTLRTKNEMRATTGSGVFIDSRGVILTNAHVAQFLLLANRESGRTTTCSIRTGSPARAHYTAELLYIPPLWVSENAKELKNENPSGTGERDYALLYVVNAVEGILPTKFPALAYDTTPLRNKAKHQAIIAAGFPAEIIKTDGLKADLRPTIATTTITELFTYTANKVDLVGIAPSAVGEGGSSGGPIVTLDNTLIGIITTRGDEKKEGANSLRAITLPYIDRTIREEMGVGLREYLKNKIPERARIFNDTMTPLLSKIVREALGDSAE